MKENAYTLSIGHRTIPALNSADTDKEERFPLNTQLISRRISFNHNGSLTVRNLSAFWIPKITVHEVIHGTAYTVTGSYEGSELFTKKLERIMARKTAGHELLQAGEENSDDKYTE